jgi:hypothetical protein
MAEKTRAEHEDDRTQILRLLVEAGFHPVPVSRILVVLDQTFHSLSLESLDFHLRLMAEKGWVEIGEESLEPGKGRRLIYAKITAEGVEEYDRRGRRLIRIGPRK